MRRDPPDVNLEQVLGRARSVASHTAGGDGARRPPPDPGVVLAELPRDDGTVLRVAVQKATGTGAPYISLAVWSGDWPVKGRSVSVRLRELGAVLAAFIEIAERRAEWVAK